MSRLPVSAASLVRLLLAISGSFAWLCAAVAIRQGLFLASHSPLLWGIAAMGAAGGLAAYWGAVQAGDQSIESRLAQGIAYLNRTREVPRDCCPRAGGGLIAFSCLLFAANTCWVYQHQDTPFDDDQGAFLLTAREIHDRGGLVQLWGDLWSGQFEESNRHPLLLAIQSLYPTVEFGRAVSCSLAILTGGLALRLVWRRFGPLTAGVLSVLLATNGAWLYHAPRLVCESLLTGLAGLAWLMLSGESWGGNRVSEGLVAAISGHSPSATRPPPTSSLNPQRSALIGVVLGLVYLTKGTGLLLLAGTAFAYGLHLMGLPGERRRGIISLTALACAFLVTASPLLTRNQIRFGSPTFNVNSYLLWVDAYESPNAMAERMTMSEARAAYLTTHSVADLVQREATGLAWEAFIGLRILGPAPWDDSRVLFGLPLCALGLLGLFHAPRLAALTLIFWTLIIWGMMAWYIPIAAGDRFMMPLMIPWLTLATNGLVRIRLLGAAPPAASRQIVIAAILWGVATTALVWTQNELWSC